MPLIKKTKKSGAVTATKEAVADGKTYTGYCVKCKEKGVELKDAKVDLMKNGRKIAKGKHEKCGTTVCCILGKDA
jgi:hypothetical protein